MPLFKAIPYYAQFWTDRIKVTRLDTGKSVARKSICGFSNKRNVFADFNAVEILLRTLLNELEEKSFLKPAREIALQQMERTEGGLSVVIWRAYIDSAEHAGAIRSMLIEGEMEHSNTAVLKKLKDLKAKKNR